MSNADKIRENVKKEVRQETAKMKEMSWSDRFWYIGEYYKYHIVGVLLIIALISIIGTSIYNRTLTTRLYLIVLNNPAVLTENFDPLTEDYAAARGFGKKDRIHAESMSLPADGSANRSAMSATSKIAALITAKQLDLLIADPIAFEDYAAVNTLLDLDTVLPEDLREQLKDRILFAADESGETLPMGIDLSGAPLLEEMHIVMEKPCLSIVTNSTRTDECIAFLRYLFQS